MNGDVSCPEKFIWGTQYLRGLSPASGEWERDLKKIASLGFNTVRVWLVWGILESEEGQIDFDYIERILSLAEKNRLRIIFLFHLHSIPEWAVNKFRKYWYVGRNGLPFEPAARPNTPSGGWPGLCPDHPEVQKLEERFLSGVVRYIGNRAFAYEPINEPHMWMDITLPRGGEYCHCEATREAFREYLRGKYRTLEALGDAWGRRFDHWESVRTPTWSFGYADWVDFREFTMVNIAGLVERRADIIRRYTTRPVIAHAWGGGSLCCPQLGGMAFDDWRNAAKVDMWGCSGFPDSLEATPRLAMSMDATRAAAGEKIFWQSELGAGNLGLNLDFKTPATPNLLALWCWISVFSGAKGVLFWQFRPELYGNESGHFSLADRAGEPTDRALAVSGIASVIKQYEPDFMAVNVPEPEVAILFNPRGFLLDWTMHQNNSFSCDAVGGYYDAFFHADIPVDFLHIEDLKQKISRYKLVIIPAGIALSDEHGEILSHYTANGGSVLADPLTGSWDGNLKLSSVVPGAGLSTLFGVEERFCGGDGGTVKISRNEKIVSLPHVSLYESWRALSPLVSAWAQYEDGCIAIAENRYGKGRAFITGIGLGNLNAARISIGDDLRNSNPGETSSQQAEELILALAETIGIKQEFKTEKPLFLRRLLLPDDRELLLLLNLSKAPFSGKLRRDPGCNRSYRGIFGIPDTGFTRGELTVTLPPASCAVLLELSR